jgi:hypothetical protein
VTSLTCFLKVSSESLPLLMRLPRSLCLALSTIRQGVAEVAHGAADRLRQHEPGGADDEHDHQHDQVEHSPRLQPNRRSIAVTLVDVLPAGRAGGSSATA